MRTLIAAIALFGATLALALSQGAGSAEACAGLIGSNGAVNLGRTTTLAAYHDGVEHYVTAFEFQGGGGEFGALIPLPGVPTSVERGGDWTLQRLQRETQPVFKVAGFGGDAALAGAPAEVIQTARIDALDLTVLKGGGPDVAVWAQQHGFRLSPDSPEVLDFYAQRSPIFVAAVFDGDAAAARGQKIGDGTPVHLTIPTDNPWVPLRILGLGKQPDDRVQADVFLITDQQPAFIPGPGNLLPPALPVVPGLQLRHNAKATDQLLDDLRADAGMGWIPRSAWLTKLEVDSAVSDLHYDLAVDTSGLRSPSHVDAGLDIVPSVPQVFPEDGGIAAAWLWAAVVAALGLVIIAGRGLARAR